MATEGSLAWQIEDAEGAKRVTLTGDLDEDCGLEGLVARLAGGSIVVDLAGVTRINSCGVREWINFVQRVSAKKLVLQRCSVPFVNQLNLISNFVGNGHVTSIFAPYFCEKCGEDRPHLIEVRADIQLDETLPCPVCKGAMVFDDLPDQFLTFVRAPR